ncbi:MAG: Tad domain-containing protein [Saccharofermentanales bacterium]
MKSFINKMKHHIHDESGTSIIIVSLSMTFIMIIAALVIDIGLAYYKTAQLENAVDSAALAAGQLMPVSTNDSEKIYLVKAKAVEYAAKNGITNVQTSNIVLKGVVNGVYTQLAIDVPMQVETTLASVIGIKTINFSRNSKIKIAPCKKVSNLVPLSIEKANMDYYIANGQTTHLALKFGGGGGTVGAYGAIDLDGVSGGGANDYENWLTNGYTPILSVGEQLYPIETGNMAGATNDALLYRYNECTHFPEYGGCTLAHFNINCPRVVKVPVVEYDSNHFIRIRGFAAFIIEPISESGYIYGSFIKIIASGEPADNINVGDPLDYGIYSIRLIN